MNRTLPLLLAAAIGAGWLLDPSVTSHAVAGGFAVAGLCVLAMACRRGLTAVGWFVVLAWVAGLLALLLGTW